MNDHFYDLVNDKGRPFTAVYAPAGGERGASTVTFYDATYEYIKYPGQMVSAYYVSSIIDHRGGLNLHGGVDEWRLSEFNVLDTREWLRRMEAENSA